MCYGTNDEIEMATSQDGINWTGGNLIIDLPTGSTHLGAPDLKYINGVFYLFANGNFGNLNISLFKCTDPDPTNQANWSRVVDAIIPSGDFPVGAAIIDPSLIYFPDGFDPGNGDGSHVYWLQFGLDTTGGGVEVQEAHLYYSDNIESGWTAANGGNPIKTIAGTDDIYPGDFIQVGSEIHWLYSFRDEATDKIDMRWTESTDLITWNDQAGVAIDPDDFPNYEWCIEGDIHVEGSELWIYFAANEEITGQKDAIIRRKLNAEPNTVEL